MVNCNLIFQVFSHLLFVAILFTPVAWKLLDWLKKTLSIAVFGLTKFRNNQGSVWYLYLYGYGVGLVQHNTPGRERLSSTVGELV